MDISQITFQIDLESPAGLVYLVLAQDQHTFNKLHYQKFCLQSSAPKINFSSKIFLFYLNEFEYF